MAPSHHCTDWGVNIKCSTWLWAFGLPTFDRFLGLPYTLVQDRLNGLTIWGIQGSAVLTGSTAIYLNDSYPQVMLRLQPLSSLDYRAHHWLNLMLLFLYTAFVYMVGCPKRSKFCLCNFHCPLGQKYYSFWNLKFQKYLQWIVISNFDMISKRNFINSDFSRSEKIVTECRVSLAGISAACNKLFVTLRNRTEFTYFFTVLNCQCIDWAGKTGLNVKNNIWNEIGLEVLIRSSQSYVCSYNKWTLLYIQLNKEWLSLKTWSFETICSE